MDIIVKINRGDGHTFWFTEIIPIEYDSVESAMLDFEILLNQRSRNPDRDSRFVFGGSVFEDIESMGRILCFVSLDEWIEGFRYDASKLQYEERG